MVVDESKSILLKDMAGAKLGIWVAHGEGQFWRMGIFTLDIVWSSTNPVILSDI